MKSLLRMFPLMAGLLLSATAQETLDDARKAFDAEHQKIDENYRTDLGKLKEQLLIALGKSREAAKKSGDLDAVKAMDAELERWKKEDDLPLVDPENAEILKLYGVYKTAEADRLLKKQKSVVAWSQSYEARLAGLEKRLVADDRIKDAEEVRAEREKYRGSLFLKEALDAVKAAEANAAPKTPAKKEKEWKSLKDLKPGKIEGNQFFKDNFVKRTNPVKVNGIQYQKEDFIYTHAAGRLEYEFEEPVSEFRGAVCLLDASSTGDVLFSVRTNEGEVFKSKLICPTLRRQDFSLTFKPTKKLILIVNEDDDIDQDWAFWLKPEYR